MQVQPANHQIGAIASVPGVLKKNIRRKVTALEKVHTDMNFWPQTTSHKKSVVYGKPKENLKKANFLKRQRSNLIWKIA